MSRFKVGDTVVCIDPHGEILKKGSHYIIERIEINTNVRLKGVPDLCWMQSRFRLVEEVNGMSNNPAIEEYTKTVTVRKLRPVSVITINHERNRIKGIKQRNEIIVEAGYKGVLLKTRGHQSYECFVDADELRTLAKQLTEIADVLDETTKN